MFTLTKDISKELQENGFAVVSGEDFTLQGNYQPLANFINSWENMSKDEYYGNEGKAIRYRRYSDFNYNPVSNELSCVEHRAYYQSKSMNNYVGGIERHFEDIDETLINNPIIKSLVQIDFDIYKSILPAELWDKEWQCQIHQIRIEIEPNQEIEITPEGIHSDGYPFSAVHFGGKQNVSGANSQVFTKNKDLLIETRFENVLDTLYFKDKELMHYVTPAKSVSDNKGYRQIIAISFSLPGSDYDTVR